MIVTFDDLFTSRLHAVYNTALNQASKLDVLTSNSAQHTAFTCAFSLALFGFSKCHPLMNRLNWTVFVFTPHKEHDSDHPCVQRHYECLFFNSIPYPAIADGGIQV